ncbi:MAG: hypothetical protein V1816_27265 [Pseudomonadota bacterium]
MIGYLMINPVVYRELMVLKAVEADPTISQHKIGKRLEVTGAAINLIMKKLVHHGFVELRGANLRRISYRLTPAGLKRLDELSMTFIRNSAKLLTQAKEEASRALGELEEEGASRLVLYGVGDIMELVWLAAADLNFQVVGLIDDDPDLQGTRKFNLIVGSPETLIGLDFDCLVITASRNQDRITAGLAALGGRFKIRGITS